VAWRVCRKSVFFSGVASVDVTRLLLTSWSPVTAALVMNAMLLPSG